MAEAGENTRNMSQAADRRTIAGRSLRWDEERANAAYAEGWWVKETLADALNRAVHADPLRVVLVDGTHRVTTADLQAQATAMAQTMAERMEPGSVVSFMLPNWHEAAVIYLGATLAGMVAHPILPSLREHDLKFMLRDIDSRMIFVPAEFRGHDYVAMSSAVTDEMDDPPEVIVVRGDAGKHTRYTALFEAGDATHLPPVDPDAARMIMYTSGTTGSPKGVIHTHNSLHALIRQLGRHWLIEPGDAFLVPSPISHIGGSIYAFEMPLLLGTTAVLMERWEPAEGLVLLENERCTHMAGATPFLEALLSSARAAGTRLPHLKVFICGGASVPPSLVREATEYFEKAAVSRVYGSTEVPVTTVGVIDRNDVDHAAETDGKAGIADVILAPDGEIRARGPQMLAGYVHPEDEAKVFDENGFYRTGDLGSLVDGEFLVVSGRSKDIIIRHGENISPKEVEDLLVGHPDIADIAIVGVPDERTGERACAVIVPAGEAKPDVQTLSRFLQDKGLAKFKIPEQVALWDALPRNDAGKVLKHKIRDTLIAG
jgi:acyl-CoA synthetase (AMP-forming)/AMP-acid ligase II